MFLNWTSLTLSQTTNISIFQTERVSKRQFQNLWKWHKVLRTGRKHCGKMRNCSLRAISLFSYSVFRRLVLHTLKIQGLIGKGLTFCRIILLVVERKKKKNFFYKNQYYPLVYNAPKCVSAIKSSQKISVLFIWRIFQAQIQISFSGGGGSHRKRTRLIIWYFDFRISMDVSLLQEKSTFPVLTMRMSPHLEPFFNLWLYFT